MVDVNVQGFNAVDAARNFGVRNTAASEVLEANPVNSRDFSESEGDLASTADRISLRGGVNRTVPRVEDGLASAPPTVTGEIVSNTNPVSFAVQNAIEQPFERQGKLVGDSGGINTTA
jgi:hypothetical protein